MKPKVKSNLRKIFFVSTLLGLLLFILGLLFTYLYEDRLKQFAIEQINQQLDAKIKVEKIDLSLWKRFPFVSLNFTKVLISNNKVDSKVANLVNAAHIYLSFDLIQIFKKDYQLENILIEDAALNLYFDKEGKHNFHIFKESGEGDPSFFVNLNSVKFKNTRLNFINEATEQSLVLFMEKVNFSGSFSQDKFDIRLNGKNQVVLYQSKGRELVRNHELDIDVHLNIEPQNGHYKLSKGLLTYQGLALQLEGDLLFAENNIELEANLIAKDVDIEELISQLPEENKSAFESYHLDGRLSLNASIKGSIGGEQFPTVQLEASFNQLSFTEPFYKIPFSQVAFKLLYNNGKQRSLASSTVQIISFNSANTWGKVAGNFKILNLWKPQIAAKINSTIDLEKLNTYLQIDTIETISGAANIETLLSVNVNYNEATKRWEMEYLDMNHVFSLSQVNIKLQQSPQTYSHISAKGVANQNDIQFEQLSLNTGNSNITFSGAIMGLGLNTTLAASPLKVEGTLQADHLSYEQIAAAMPSEGGTDSRFPEDILIGLQFRFNDFVYQGLNLQHFSGKFTLRNQKIQVEQVQLACLGGEVSGSLYLDGSEQGKYMLYNQGKLRGLDIQKTFQQFNNFDQSMVTAQNIKGKLNSDYIFKCTFNQDWELLNPSIELNSDMEMQNGELINVEALNSLKNYTKIKDFSNIHFSTIRNSITIKESKVYIPNMVVNSDKMNIKVSGIHDFENQYEYHFEVLLSEIMGKQYKEKLEDEFGEIENDGYGKTRIFLSLIGKGEKFEVKYNRSGLTKKLQQDMQEEKQSLKNALKEEFGWFKKEAKKDSLKMVITEKQQEKAKLKSQEEGQYILEWEDE
jgi:hypothetical protein